MPFRIQKSIEIENGHMLSRHPDKCRFPHGHSRRVEIILEAPNLDPNGMVCDFKVVKDIASAVLEPFDHALCVNTSDPMFQTLRAAYGPQIIPFDNTEPTTEVLAKAFFDAISGRLRDYACQPDARYPVTTPLRVARVRVWETSTSWAEYFEEPGPFADDKSPDPRY